VERRPRRAVREAGGQPAAAGAEFAFCAAGDKDTVEGE
jgi:hypothetical protein